MQIYTCSEATQNLAIPLEQAEVVIPNVRLNMAQLLSAIRQLDEPSRIQVAEVLAETEMNGKTGNLMERLGKKEPVEEISDANIEAEIRAEPDLTIEHLCRSETPCLIKTEDHRNLVILSQQAYDSIMETLHLLKSPRNAERLLRSLAHAREGKLLEKELIEE